MSGLFKINKTILSALICLISAVSVPLLAQKKKIDSLLLVLSTLPEDTNKVNLILNLSGELLKSNPDTAIVMGEEARQLAAKIGWQEGVATTSHNLGMFNRLKGNYEACIQYYKEALRLYDSLEKDPSPKVKSRISAKKLKTIGNLGFVYSAKGNYPQALHYYLEALRIAEASGDKSAVARNLANIGGLHLRNKNLEKAIDFIGRALKIFESLGDKSSTAAMQSNFAGIYESQGDHAKALEYCQKAKKIFEETNDKNNLSLTLGNIGNIYETQKDYKTATNYFLQAIELDEATGNKGALAVHLGNLGELFLHSGNNNEAEVYLKKSLAIDEAIGSLDGQEIRTNLLHQVYEKTGNYKLAFEFYKRYIAIRDSITNEENTKKQTRLEMQYEFDKKTAADSLKNAEAKKLEEISHQSQIQSQKLYTYAGLGGFLIMIVIAGISFIAFKNKKKANIEIARQKAMVDEKQKEILDSIYYARRIQRTLLASEKYIERNLRKLNRH